MRKLSVYLASILLIFTSHAALAQHSGHGMGGSMGNGSYGHDSSAMKDMQRMIALQANDEQKAQFRSWTQTTETLRQELQGLDHVVDSEGYANKIASIKVHLADAKSGKERLERSLTSAQQTGLKKNIQKVSKASDQLSQAIADAIRELEQSDGKKKAPKIGKAVQAANRLSAEQKNLGTEMSI